MHWPLKETTIQFDGNTPPFCLNERNTMSSIILAPLAAINVVPLVVACVIGGIAGFLAGQIMKGRGFGLLGNIIVGIVGSLIFGYLFGSLNLLGNAFVDSILGGTVGAVILLVLIGLVKKAA